MIIRGFTDVARMLAKRYGEKVSRQQVYQWWARETQNRSGQPFPYGTEIPDALRGRPNREFDSAEILRWVKPGVPDPRGNRWRKLGEKIPPAEE